MRKIWQWVVLFITSGFTVGFWPNWFGKLIGREIESFGGWMGSLLGFGIQYWFMDKEYGALAITIAIPLTFCLGWFVVGAAERFYIRVWNSFAGRTHDLNWDCIDEVMGQFIAGLPAMWHYSMTGEAAKSWVCLIASFLLFRLYDGKKWWPVDMAESYWHGTSFGIMFDDTVAGGVAAVLSIFLLVA